MRSTMFRYYIEPDQQALYSMFKEGRMEASIVVGMNKEEGGKEGHFIYLKKKRVPRQMPQATMMGAGSITTAPDPRWTSRSSHSSDM